MTSSFNTRRLIARLEQELSDPAARLSMTELQLLENEFFMMLHKLKSQKLDTYDFTIRFAIDPQRVDDMTDADAMVDHVMQCVSDYFLPWGSATGDEYIEVMKGSNHEDQNCNRVYLTKNKA